MPHEGLRADTAFVMTTILRGVISRGTAAAGYLISPAINDAFTVAKGMDRYAMYVFDYGAPVGWRLAVKNPHFFDAQNVCIDQISYYPTNDAVSAERRVLPRSSVFARARPTASTIA